VLYFLKLGGSLITDKTQAHTVRRETLKRLADEIAAALILRSDLQLLIGHGSGSFGHVPASKYATRNGVQSAEQWWGFIEVYKEARALNQIVLETLLDSGLPVIAFPPSASVIGDNHSIKSWDLQPVQAALTTGCIPLINGDVIYDLHLGGTILSTEELFADLAPKLRPNRILLAGIEAGVWSDFPLKQHLVREITSASYKDDSSALGGSMAVDVTGGMRQKVESMLALTGKLPGFQAIIFSGEEPGVLYQTLLGDTPGTRIHA
jgi:isopentenyl phosphate kinase